MPRVLFRIWLVRTVSLALPLGAIGIWASVEQGFTAIAACLSALGLVSAITYAALLILATIFDWEWRDPPPVDC
jgi:hypothetical protein